MQANVAAPAREIGRLDRSVDPMAARLPSPLARRALLFESLALLEYWIAPPLFGVTNYAGLWSWLGTVLFVAFVGTLLALVVVPLLPRLTGALPPGRWRAAFHAMWLSAVIASLAVTDALQLAPTGATTRGVQIGSTSVYSAFGAWPSPTVYLAPIGLFVTLDAQLLLVVGLIAFLGASALFLGLRRSAGGAEAGRSGGRSRPIAALAVWGPLGLVTGCSACAPAYLALIGWFVPAAPAVLGFVPLVPWIGLAGILYLASFWIALSLLGKATDPVASSCPTPLEGS